MMPKIRISKSIDAEKCTQKRQKRNFDIKNFLGLVASWECFRTFASEDWGGCKCFERFNANPIFFFIWLQESQSTLLCKMLVDLCTQFLLKCRASRFPTKSEILRPSHFVEASRNANKHDCKKIRGPCPKPALRVFFRLCCFGNVSFTKFGIFESWLQLQRSAMQFRQPQFHCPHSCKRGTMFCEFEDSTKKPQNILKIQRALSLDIVGFESTRCETSKCKIFERNVFLEHVDFEFQNGFCEKPYERNQHCNWHNFQFFRNAKSSKASCWKKGSALRRVEKCFA